MGDWLQKLLHGLTSKVTQGSQGSKEVISAKMLLLLHITWYDHEIHAYEQAPQSLQNLLK